MDIKVITPEEYAECLYNAFVAASKERKHACRMKIKVKYSTLRHGLIDLAKQKEASQLSSLPEDYEIVYTHTENLGCASYPDFYLDVQRDRIKNCKECDKVIKVGSYHRPKKDDIICAVSGRADSVNITDRLLAEGLM